MADRAEGTASRTQKETAVDMSKYESIQDSIQRAQAQRSVYLAELIADGIVATIEAARRAARWIVSASRAKAGRNVFTFDA